jgi:AcrR family transcriptional regulator
MPVRMPRQKRSQATRDAIVEAAARVFAEHGLERSTTARIAEVAGVSPGSMYQYFPSKDALVTALFERESNAQHARLLELAAEMGIDDVRALIRAFLDWSVAEFEKKRPLYRVLLHEVPKVSGLRPTMAIDHTAARSLRLLLELGKSRCQARDLDAAAMIFVRAFRYTVMGVIDEPFANDGAREAFVEELTDMLTLYLLVPRPWR